jgi:isopentenyl phosphate kinase
MGTLANLTIVKLGGSLITFKDQPLSINLPALQVVARELRNFLSSEKPRKIFLIHGGGSFGHFYAKQFSLNTKFSRIEPEGVAMTLTSMLQLHSLVLKQLISKKVFCATLLPSELVSLDGKGITPNGATRIQSILSSELIPITFGNVLLRDGKARVISGDEIALALVRKFRAKKVIFVMDVDGIYPTAKLEGAILDSVSSNQKVESLLRSYDVTGGVEKKLRTGIQMNKAGAEVFFLNGSKEGRLSAALIGKEDVLGTKIPLRKGKR